MNAEIEKKTHELIELIKESETYQTFEKSLQRVEEHPGLRGRVDEFRARTFHMYSTVDEEELFEATDRLEDEYHELRSIPEVNAFLEAEIELCQVLKETEAYIDREINVQVPVI